MDKDNLFIGIDFGTSNSSVAVFDGNNTKLLPIDKLSQRPEVVKTVLYITREQQVYIGEEAIQVYYKQNLNRQRRFVRQWVGEVEYRGADMFYISDVYVYVDELTPGRILQFLKSALRNPNYSGTSIFGESYKIERLVSIYLRNLKERAESLIGIPIQKVALGRPVKLADTQDADKKAENRLLQAALDAGFTEIQFELEPIAAALNYELTLSRPENVLVFDFGGGTLDITVMRVGQGERHIFSTGGVDIAGSLFDAAIIHAKLLGHFGQDTFYGAEKWRFPHHVVESIADWLTLPTLGTLETKKLLDDAIKTSNYPCRIENLKSLIFNEYGFSFYNQVEQAKIRLSTDTSATMSLQGEGLFFWQLLTRLQFENIISNYINQIESCLLATLANSGIKKQQIDRIVLTGGSSNIPVFIDGLARIFGASKLVRTDAFTSIASGLAIKASEYFNKN